MKPFAIFALTMVFHLAANASPGQLISTTPMPGLTAQDVSQDISDYCSGSAKPKTVYAVQRYKLTYETTDAQGQPTTASGVISFPKGLSGPLPLVSYQHGTITDYADSPSQGGEEGEIVSSCFSGQGYVVADADYLGLGDSKIFQTWYDAATEASATADMLRASRQAAPALNIQLGSQLFLLGFSQGGHSTMALHQYLEQSLASEFTVTASAPISGPYDVELNFLDALNNGSFVLPYKLAFIVYSMNYVYDIYQSLDEVMMPAVVQQLPEIFDGENSVDDLPGLFPDTPQLLLQANFISDVSTNSANPLRVVMRQNNTYNWKPLAPVRIYYGESDTTVDPKHASLAYNTMKGLGADVTLLNLGQVDHEGSLPPGFAQALQWFGTLR